jgi:hypothetical protein
MWCSTTFRAICGCTRWMRRWNITRMEVTSESDDIFLTELQISNHSNLLSWQFIATADFSPIIRPDDEGVIESLCRVDEKGGLITKLFNCIRPGSVIYMLCAMGGLRLQLQDNFILFRDKTKRLGLLAGGTDIAPIIPIIRAYSDHVRKNGSTVPLHGLNLIYAVEGEHDLANMQVLESKCCHLISYCSAYWTYCSSNQYIDVV